MAACTDAKETPSPDSLLPATYQSDYTMVRDCRTSGDHDFNRIRVLADPQATGPYMTRTSDFPVGSIVVKEEYDPSDESCSGEILDWTIMSRLGPGTSTATIDWTWQRENKRTGAVIENDRGCIGCHQVCGIPPDGYLGTCALP